MRVGGDVGGLVVGWLVKLTVTLSALGLVGFDLVSVGAGRFQAEDHAQTAVRAAAETYRASRSPQVAYDAALAEVLAEGDTIDVGGWSIAPDGRVTLTLRREVPTVLLDRIGPLRRWATVTSTVTSGPAS